MCRPASELCIRISREGQSARYLEQLRAAENKWYHEENHVRNEKRKRFASVTFQQTETTLFALRNRPTEGGIYGSHGNTRHPGVVATVSADNARVMFCTPSVDESLRVAGRAVDTAPPSVRRFSQGKCRQVGRVTVLPPPCSSRAESFVTMIEAHLRRLTVSIEGSMSVITASFSSSHAGHIGGVWACPIVLYCLVFSVSARVRTDIFQHQKDSSRLCGGR